MSMRNCKKELARRVLGAAGGMTIIIVMMMVAARPAQALVSELSIPTAPWKELDARSYAMGGAYTAVADGVAATYWNPAGLATSPWLQLEVGLQPQVMGADWQTMRLLWTELNSGHPDPERIPDRVNATATLNGGGGLAFRTAGAALWVQAAGQIVADKEAGSWQANAYYWVEGAAGGGLAAPVSLPGLGRVAAGAAARRVVAGTTWVGQDPPVPQPGAGGNVRVTRTSMQVNAAGNGLDLGIRMELSPRLVVAGVVKNLGLGLAGTATTRSEVVEYAGGEPQPPEVSERTQPFYQAVAPTWRVGVAVKPFLPGVVVAVDLEENRTMHVGGEWALPGRLVSLRAGAVVADSQAAEYRLGAGVKLGLLAADAAASWQQGRLKEGFLQAGLQF
ncbi:MAG: hypothetical protein IMX00_09990 [Limnochordales bacterium]|nr:hypothetical protein [Limnochordales bacterium]